MLAERHVVVHCEDPFVCFQKKKKKKKNGSSQQDHPKCCHSFSYLCIDHYRLHYTASFQNFTHAIPSYGPQANAALLTIYGSVLSYFDENVGRRLPPLLPSQRESIIPIHLRQIWIVTPLEILPCCYCPIKNIIKMSEFPFKD
jgi:hypothetical protein